MYVKEIYPSVQNVEKVNKHINRLYTKLYDTRDDFNFPFFSSNIPSGPSNSVHISQLIRYARFCDIMMALDDVIKDLLSKGPVKPKEDEKGPPR